MKYNPETVLYCRKCLVETPVYPMRDHPLGCIDLGCKVCGTFLTRLKKSYRDEWEIDPTVYQKGFKRRGNE